MGSFFFIVAIAVAAPPPLRNAYCPIPIRSVAHLEKIVRTDPPVRDRYMRHFAMSQPELSAYFASLKMEHAAQAEDVTMYAVPRSGIITSHPYRIRRGEAVIVDSSGAPVICPACGNPFTLGRKSLNADFLLPTIGQPAEAQLKALVEPTPSTDVIGMVSPIPPTELTEPNLIADETQSPETSQDVIAAALAPTAQPQVQILAAAASGAGFPWLPLLGAGGLAGALASHGGSPPLIVPVPEPLPLALFIGAPLLLLRRRNGA